MIGSRKWMEINQGSLSFKEKINLIKQTLLPITYKYSKTFIQSHIQPARIAIQDVRIPDTPIVKEAIAELENTRDQAIFHHSWRSFFWGAGIAQSKDWQFDQESFLIACLMHDLGLVAHLDQYSCHCFTYESALRSERLCLKHRYDESRTKIISEAICLHMNGYLDESNQNLPIEALLLHQATSCDVIGTDYVRLSKTYAEDVLTEHPRTQFNSHFKKLLHKESLNHPQSRTALLSGLGLPYMIQLNIFKE